MPTPKVIDGQTYQLLTSRAAAQGYFSDNRHAKQRVSGSSALKNQSLVRYTDVNALADSIVGAYNANQLATNIYVGEGPVDDGQYNNIDRFVQNILLNPTAGITQIVAVGQSFESGRTKFSPYFDANNLHQYQSAAKKAGYNLSVQRVAQDQSAGAFPRYRLQLTPTNGGMAKVIEVTHIDQWPDHAALSSQQMQDEAYLSQLNQIYHQSKTSATFMHCSAGVGRSGSLAFAFALLRAMEDPSSALAQAIKAEWPEAKAAAIFQIWDKMNEQRPTVQNPGQMQIVRLAENLLQYRQNLKKDKYVNVKKLQGASTEPLAAPGLSSPQSDASTAASRPVLRQQGLFASRASTQPAAQQPSASRVIYPRDDSVALSAACKDMIKFLKENKVFSAVDPVIVQEGKPYVSPLWMQYIKLALITPVKNIQNLTVPGVQDVNVKAKVLAHSVRWRQYQALAQMNSLLARSDVAVYVRQRHPNLSSLLDKVFKKGSKNPVSPEDRNELLTQLSKQLDLTAISANLLQIPNQKVLTSMLDTLAGLCAKGGENLGAVLKNQLAYCQQTVADYLLGKVELKALQSTLDVAFTSAGERSSEWKKCIQDCADKLGLKVGTLQRSQTFGEGKLGSAIERKIASALKVSVHSVQTLLTRVNGFVDNLQKNIANEDDRVAALEEVAMALRSLERAPEGANNLSLLADLKQACVTAKSVLPGQKGLTALGSVKNAIDGLIKIAEKSLSVSSGSDPEPDPSSSQSFRP